MGLQDCASGGRVGVAGQVAGHEARTPDQAEQLRYGAAHADGDRANSRGAQ